MEIKEPDLSRFEARIVNTERVWQALPEADTEGASAALVNARALLDEIEEAASAPLAEAKAAVSAAEKATLPLRKAAKAAVERITEALDVRFRQASALLDELTQKALAENDHDTLRQLPDSPPLAEGVGYAELKRVRIVCADHIPREHLVPDVKSIEVALRCGKHVPGAVLETVYSWRRSKGR